MYQESLSLTLNDLFLSCRMLSQTYGFKLLSCSVLWSSELHINSSRSYFWNGIPAPLWEKCKWVLMTQGLLLMFTSPSLPQSLQDIPLFQDAKPYSLDKVFHKKNLHAPGVLIHRKVLCSRKQTAKMVVMSIVLVFMRDWRRKSSTWERLAQMPHGQQHRLLPKINKGCDPSLIRLWSLSRGSADVFVLEDPR